MSALSRMSGINHVGIRVASFARSRAFYKLLGFEWLVGPIGPEPVSIMQHPSGMTLNLILNGVEHPNNPLMDEPVKLSGITHIALETTDADAVAAELEAAGVSVTERMELPGGAIAVFCRDPDHTTIEFHQPGERFWPLMGSDEAKANEKLAEEKGY
eukprot:TRINITY_DN17156_c0_g4_i1.p1 TRINITY_DN17156_c0_g4~~TRINITY_DN17156_c0_g4_i1.p1  ORF type:complete len:157 (+),score=44.94 TRINITY_DN17156_c0_g4_i1:82-552(+)